MKAGQLLEASAVNVAGTLSIGLGNGPVAAAGVAAAARLDVVEVGTTMLMTVVDP